MKNISTFFTLFVCICTLANSALAEQNYSVGFQLIEAQTKSGFSGGVWYPSVDREFERKLGPFRPKWAWGGKSIAGKRPVILFSHGVMGRFRNHRDTAETLARHGYIVIIPQHTKDQWVGTAKTVAVVEHRIAEFSRTLREFALAQPEIAKLIDEQNIGAIGYSLGGLTVLGSSGAIPNTKYVVEHCLKNKQNDANFCLGDSSWWEKIWPWIAGTDIVHWYYETGLTGKEVVAQIEPSIQFKAIAMVAPVAAAYYPEEVQKIDSKMALFRLESDQINRFPFHVDYIHHSLGEREHFYKVYKDAHHFAFISPYPEWLLKEEYIPVAIDPEGFDRKVFLKEINNDILTFFEEVMPISK
jgi:predicted dienelactone hydrolase|tara:strand:- start:101 stop:1168 length:1068 start_codon:yes stop_codon:yes gene_type:complete